MAELRLPLDQKIRFIVSVPDWRPTEATPLQGFSLSLCENSGLLRFFQRMPADIFEFTPEARPYHLAQRIAGTRPVTWYGQSPRAIRSYPLPSQMPFTVVFLDSSEKVLDYEEWLKNSDGIPTIVSKEGGHLNPSSLSIKHLQDRFIEVCKKLRSLNRTDGISEAEKAISSWIEPEPRIFPHEIGGHGTIAPNAAVLRMYGFEGIGYKPFSRLSEGEKAHIEQIVWTTNAVFEERNKIPRSLANQIYPRTPDLNIYCPATYDIKSFIKLSSDLDRDTQKNIATAIRLLDRQPSYSFEITSDAQKRALLGITPSGLLAGETPVGNPIMSIRQRELWLATEAVGCLAVSELGAVVRLPNRVNLARGAVRQFAQHYRADRPQVFKRREMFRKVQRAIAAGFPEDLQQLFSKSQDGIRIISDAHVEWLNVRGIPLGLRYNVSRIPVTPGNGFIEQLSTPPLLFSTPEDFRQVLVVSGLPKGDIIAKQFEIAFDTFGDQWRDTLNIKHVRVSNKQQLIDAINSFEGMVLVFDGHGSHGPDEPGVIWLDEEAVNVWDLRGEIKRVPPIIILSACDTHAADRNHATVANGFLALGARSVLGSVFPLHASHAAIFTARLLYRVSAYIPAAIELYKRSLTWLEVVSGMLRRQVTTDILRHLEALRIIPEDEDLTLTFKLQMLADTAPSDPMSEVYQMLLDQGIGASALDSAIESAIASSSTISYLHLGRPETILINTRDNVMQAMA